MSFENWSEFWAMGGHGLYVWLCYGVGIVAFIGLGVAPFMQKKRVLRELAAQQRRAQSAEQGGLSQSKLMVNSSNSEGPVN